MDKDEQIKNSFYNQVINLFESFNEHNKLKVKINEYNSQQTVGNYHHRIDVFGYTLGVKKFTHIFSVFIFMEYVGGKYRQLVKFGYTNTVLTELGTNKLSKDFCLSMPTVNNKLSIIAEQLQETKSYSVVGEEIASIINK